MFKAASDDPAHAPTADTADLPEALRPYASVATNAYPDLHDHVSRAGPRRTFSSSSTSRSTKTREMHPLGALAISRRHRGKVTARPSSSPSRSTVSGRRNLPAQSLSPGWRQRPDVYQNRFRSSRSTEIGATLAAGDRRPDPSPASSPTRPARRWSTIGAALDMRRARRSMVCPCRSRRRAGTMRHICRPAITSPRIRIPAIPNLGNYRGQLKAPRRLGMNPSVELRAGHLCPLVEIQGAG